MGGPNICCLCNTRCDMNALFRTVLCASVVGSSVLFAGVGVCMFCSWSESVDTCDSSSDILVSPVWCVYDCSGWISG